LRQRPWTSTHYQLDGYESEFDCDLPQLSFSCAHSKAGVILRTVLEVLLMSVYSPYFSGPNYTPGRASQRQTKTENPVVLMVEDQADTGSELTKILELNGYRVIETDNGQDAVKRALYVYPDLLLVDLNVPLLYQMMAARQIVKNARLGTVPVVIATHDDVVDTATIMELGVRRNEYVTRLSDYQQLECLLDYLLTIKPNAA
jgi:CheY-like chemotaxis protein